SLSTHSNGSDSIDLPSWAVILIVVGLVLFCGGFIAAVIGGRRQLHSLIGQVIENRYYDIPGRGTKWEIERRYVIIDKTRKLGEGAFGTVLGGRILARNIPSRKCRSIVE
ncbi:hypothetical protein PMAYCL1PPCAC_03981, partial [Pristionchus mayeri]